MPQNQNQRRFNWEWVGLSALSLAVIGVTMARLRSESWPMTGRAALFGAIAGAAGGTAVSTFRAYYRPPTSLSRGGPVPSVPASPEDEEN